MFGCCVENYFRSCEVAVDGFDGVFHDVLNAKSCGHMEDGVGFRDEFVYEFFIADITFVDCDFAFKVGDVLLGSGGHVVEDGDGVTAGDEGVGQV